MTEEFNEWKRTGKTPTRNRTADPAAHLEQAVGHEPVAANACKTFDTPVRLGIVSYRQRLADADGVSAKAAIDGLVEAGILRDDSPEHVVEVYYRQEKAAVEKTLIVIDEV